MSVRHRPRAPCLGRDESVAHAKRVRSRYQRRNALPTPPGVALRRCEIQNRGRPGGQRIAVSRAVAGRFVGSDEIRVAALSASSLTEVANRLGTGGSPGNLSSWWLASHPRVSGGASNSFRMYRGRLCSRAAASSSTTCQLRSWALVASASGRWGASVEAHRRRIARARRTLATSAPREYPAWGSL